VKFLSDDCTRRRKLQLLGGSFGNWRDKLPENQGGDYKDYADPEQRGRGSQRRQSRPAHDGEFRIGSQMRYSVESADQNRDGEQLVDVGRHRKRNKSQGMLQPVLALAKVGELVDQVRGLRTTAVQRGVHLADDRLEPDRVLRA